MTALNVETARLRWPDCTITGDGRVAVHCWICKTVQLCASPMLARAVANEKCGTNHTPQIRVLDDPTTHRYFPGQLTVPGYGRDE
jgi:hypothetical protein